MSARIDFTWVPGDPESAAGIGLALKIGETFRRRITLYEVAPPFSRVAVVQFNRPTDGTYDVRANVLDATTGTEDLTSLEADPVPGSPYEPGTVVYLTQIDGAWVVTEAAERKDLSECTRMRMEIKADKEDEEPTLELDSDSGANGTIDFTNADFGVGEFEIALPYTETIALANNTKYDYDIFAHFPPISPSVVDEVESPAYGIILAMYRVTKEEVA